MEKPAGRRAFFGKNLKIEKHNKNFVSCCSKWTQSSAHFWRHGRKWCFTMTRTCFYAISIQPRSAHCIGTLVKSTLEIFGSYSTTRSWQNRGFDGISACFESSHTKLMQLVPLHLC